MFYGWKIVATTCVTHFISVGFIFYSYGVFFKALAEEFGGSRLGVSFGLALMNLATGIFAPFLGYLLDHRSIRNIMCIGTIAMSVGFVLASQITQLWQFYFILATFLGLGAAAIGGLPSSTLVAKWFVNQRGKALGISTMGISSSGLIMAPLATLLISWIGWRHTFLVYGVASIVIVLPLVWFFIVSKPEDMGLHPDGADHDPEKADLTEPMVPMAPGDQMIDHAAHLEWSALGLLRERNFWIISLTVSLNFFSMGAMLTHLVPHATDLGFTLQNSAFILSASAGAGVLGKLLFGWITDHMDTRIGFWAAMTFQAVGVILVMNVDTYALLVAAGAVFGFGMGGIVPLWGALIGETFGRDSFGRVMGIMSPCMLPIQATGVPLAGYIYDRNGSYDLAFLTFLAFYASAAGTLLLLGKTQNRNGALKTDAIS